MIHSVYTAAFLIVSTVITPSPHPLIYDSRGSVIVSLLLFCLSLLALSSVCSVIISLFCHVPPSPHLLCHHGWLGVKTKQVPTLLLCHHTLCFAITLSVIVHLLCHHPSALSSFHFSVIGPCSAIAPLFSHRPVLCHRPLALSSSPSSVIVSLFYHRPPSLS